MPIRGRARNGLRDARLSLLVNATRDQKQQLCVGLGAVFAPAATLSAVTCESLNSWSRARRRSGNGLLTRCRRDAPKNLPTVQQPREARFRQSRYGAVLREAFARAMKARGSRRVAVPRPVTALGAMLAQRLPKRPTSHLRAPSAVPMPPRPRSPLPGRDASSRRRAVATCRPLESGSWHPFSA